jgi:trehalose-6-phosphate synthase
VVRLGRRDASSTSRAIPTSTSAKASPTPRSTLKKDEFELYYNGYANEVLWPLFHYFQRSMRYAAEQRDAYESVNRTFAQKLAPLLEPDDVIWVHDYHLIPLGRRLRELGVRRPLGFFLHIPFPNIEMLRVLPAYAELLRDLTSYDVSGSRRRTICARSSPASSTCAVRKRLRGEGRIRVGDRVIAPKCSRSASTSATVQTRRKRLRRRKS